MRITPRQSFRLIGIPTYEGRSVHIELLSYNTNCRTPMARPGLLNMYSRGNAEQLPLILYACLRVCVLETIYISVESLNVHQLFLVFKKTINTLGQYSLSALIIKLLKEYSTTRYCPTHTKNDILVLNIPKC